MQNDKLDRGLEEVLVSLLYCTKVIGADNREEVIVLHRLIESSTECLQDRTVVIMQEI